MSAYIASEQMLSSVLEGLSDPAILVEPSRRILASNRAFRYRFNAGADPRGSFCFEMTHGRCQLCDPDGVGTCPLEGAGIESVVHQHSHCMGEAYEEVFAHPVEGEIGTVSAYLLVTHPLHCSIQLVGRSQAFTRMMALVQHAAAGSSPILLWGEAGSGKTCVARALHGSSFRSQAPFIVANCAGSSDQFVSDELFGSLRSPGKRRRGLIEAARGGTLMLRGVGDLPVSLVPRIVETIGTGLFVPAGTSQPVEADVRWILSVRSASDFSAAAALPGLLRVAVPPLRARREDIRLLTERMLDRFGEGRVRRISGEALALLKQHSFPGNVRELEGLVERACIMADGLVLEPEHFPDIQRPLH